MPQAGLTVGVVTGASGGIGRWIALGLARAGQHVVLVGRNGERCEAARGWIAGQVPGAAPEVELADLALLADARQAGARIAARHPAIAVLVNNAGAFTPRREETAEGHERVLATNHLAPFVLTRALLPALRASGAARVVNVGSSSSDRARLHVDDLEGRRRWGLVHSYGQSKLALLMATRRWAVELDGSGVTVNAVHPGLVATGLVRAGGAIGLAWRVLGRWALTAEQGADTPLHVALDPAFAAVSGAYVKRRRVAAPNRLASDARLVAALWAETERLVAQDDPGTPAPL